VYLLINKNNHTSNVIYTLSDPNTNEIRYVGYSSDLKERIRGHYKPSSLKEKTHKNQWLKSLLDTKQKAKVDIIASYATAEELPAAEIEMIAYFRSIGCSLTNGTDGGDGVSKGTIPWNKGKKGLQIGSNKGKTFSEETRKRISIARRSRPGILHTEESKQKMRKPKSDEFRQKLIGNTNAKGVNKGKTWKVINGKRVWLDR
jgi:hypothetical protein